MRTYRRILPFFAILFLALYSTTSSPASSFAQTTDSSRPKDIVLILTDDQPWHTMKFMPVTNRLLGEQGVTFTNAFVTTPLCCPSRASILTGLYARNHGVVANTPPWGGAPALQDSSTVATWLKGAGYRTVFLGKYLNAYRFISPRIPPGWDEWEALVRAGFEGGYLDYLLNENGTIVEYQGDSTEIYSTNVLRDKATGYIRSTPSDQPLFLVLALIAPHTETVPDPADRETDLPVEPYRPLSFNEADVSDKPAWVQELPELGEKEQKQLESLYRRQAKTLLAVDRAVEAVVKALEETHRLSNSLIVFTSDNGYSLGEHRWTTKSCVYESCVKVPMLIRAPGVSPRIDDRLVLNIDLPLTFAELAGVTPPYQTDGRSLVDLLYNPETPWRDNILLEYLGHDFESHTNFQAVRTHRYLYAEYINGDRELYDLVEDPDQLVNREKNPTMDSILSELKGQLETYRVPADLGVSVRVSNSAEEQANEPTYTYTYRLSNYGPATAAGVALQYSVPKGTSVVSCKSTHYGECAGEGPVREVQFLSLRAGETAEIEIVLQIETESMGLKVDTVSAFTTYDANGRNNMVIINGEQYVHFLGTIQK